MPGVVGKDDGVYERDGNRNLTQGYKANKPSNGGIEDSFQVTSSDRMQSWKNNSKEWFI